MFEIPSSRIVLLFIKNFEYFGLNLQFENKKYIAWVESQINQYKQLRVNNENCIKSC